MGVYLGVDLGAAHTKAVIIDASCFIMGRAIVPTGMDFFRAGREALRLALLDAGIKPADITAAVATGYGRKNLDFAASTKTEISCHARGAFHYFPETITVVDIGGQDSKIIKIGPDGRWFDFKMNRKCAAGTGAFLEEIAGRIGVRLSELEGLARQSSTEVALSSFCTVFCATEILGMIRRGIKVPDIVKAVMGSVGGAPHRDGCPERQGRGHGRRGGPSSHGGGTAGGGHRQSGPHSPRAAAGRGFGSGPDRPRGNG